MRDKWNDVQRLMQDIREDYSGIHDSTVQHTMEVLSIADYWKNKLGTEKDMLALKVKEKDDEITCIIGYKQQLEAHIKQLESELQNEQQSNGYQEKKIERKDRDIAQLQKEIKNKENSFRQLERDILSFQQQYQDREKKLVDQVGVLSEQYKKLVETYHQNEEIIITVITEKKKLEKKIHGLEKQALRLSERGDRYRKELEHTSKDFTRHLRDILTVASGNMQFAETQFKMSAEAHAILGGIAGNIDQIVRTINEFEFLTVVPSLQKVPSDVNTFLTDIVSLVDKKAKAKGIQCAVHCGDNIPDIYIDQELMTDCMVNILNNAIEAIPDKGTIVVYTTRNITNKTVIIKIFDNGSGCHERHIPHIFEPYFSLKQGHKGMGLAVAKRIVDLHKGTIQLTSVPDKGSAVTLVLREYIHE